MNTDRILIDMFAQQAEQHPDALDVLDAVHQRIDQRRRPGVTRALPVLGAAAAVATIAIGVGAATSGGPGSPNSPAGGGAPLNTVASQPLTSSTPNGRITVTALPNATPGQMIPAKPSATRAGLPANSRDYSTIAAGWLPGPAKQIGASNQPGFEQRDYTASVAGTDMDVIIYLEGGSLPTSTEAGSHYRSITINGHAAREFIAGIATIVAVDLGNGKIAYAGPSVAATTDRVTTARITTIAEHVASAMQFNRHDPIH